MLESLAASRMYRYYADGVFATIREGWTSYLIPINWYNWWKDDDWHGAATELRQMGIQVESEAEQTIGHPVFLDTAIQMITIRQVQIKMTVDDSSSRFKRSGQVDYWQEASGGFAGQHTWTLNENNRTVNSAQWTPLLEQPGIYQVEAYIPQPSTKLEKPYTSSAKYIISHLGLHEEVRNRQSTANGTWLNLGMFYFEGGGNEFVELVDETRESSGTTVVVYDAVRWTPVDSSISAYNALTGSGFIYDAVLPGETATLEFQVVNNGFIPWEAGLITFEPDPTHIDKALRSIKLSHRVLPGETIEWTVDVPGYSITGMQTIRYRVMRSGEPFGDVITGYIFILPEEFKEFQDDLQQKIDEWQAQGIDKAEQLIELIMAEIQKELGQQVQEALEGLLSQCQLTAMVLVLSALIPAYMRRRRRNYPL
jgi:hypothetical protein